MIGASIVALIIAGAIYSPISIAEELPAGETLFKAQKCIMCHKYQKPDPTVEVVEGGPPNLWNVGDRRTAEWMIPFMKKEIDIEGRKHKVIWKGKPEDLVIVANWLAKLKDPSVKASDTTKSDIPTVPKTESVDK